MKVLIDTMGADRGVETVVVGALEAMRHRDFEAVFVGVPEEIEPLLKGSGIDEDRVSVLPAATSILNTEDPAFAIRRKKDASLVVGMKALADGEADGFLSAGSTGAILAGGLFIVKRIPGISRAALTLVLPTAGGGTVFLDAGANMDTTPEYLYQFATMGAVYAEKVLKRENPRVGLLNVGSEEGKGDKRAREAYALLKEGTGHFIGNVEAKEILTDVADVIVCDGFAGNVALKTIEGVVAVVMNTLKGEIMNSTRTKIGGALVRPAFGKLKETFDYSEFGAAPLLGTKKPVFKAHGSSNARAIETGTYALLDFIENGVIESIAGEIERRGVRPAHDDQ